MYGLFVPVPSTGILQALEIPEQEGHQVRGASFLTSPSEPHLRFCEWVTCGKPCGWGLAARGTNQDTPNLRVQGRREPEVGLITNG